MSNHYHYNYHAHHRAAPQLQSSQEIRAENNGLYEDIEVDDYDDDEDNDDYHDMPEPDEDDEDDDNDDDADTDTNDNSVQKRKRKKKDGVCVVVEVYWNGPGPAKSKKAVTSIYTDWSVSDIHDELASVLLKEQLPASLEQFRVSYVYKTEYADNIDDEDDREKKPKRRKKGKKPKAKTKRKSRSVQEISVYHYDFADVHHQACCASAKYNSYSTQEYHAKQCADQRHEAGIIYKYYPVLLCMTFYPCTDIMERFLCG